jgi:Transposase DDE domain
MISKVLATKLVEIYFYVCEKFDKELKFSCQRFTNNNNPEFTDQEIMTIYLFVISQENHYQIKRIYRFADIYLRSWFPKLPSYAAFNNRINRLSEAFRLLTDSLLQEYRPTDCINNESLVDSMPIITCSGKRSGKVAPELIDKGFCSTKSLYFYGLKLHALGFRRIDHLPFPEQLALTPASENDLNVYRDDWSSICNRTIYGDKIYHNVDYFNNLAATQNTLMLTPVKGIKNQSVWDKQFNKAADDLFSKAVSSIRQPIEAFFHWLIEKTDFQRASKVRSANGLLVHVFGKLAAAFIYLIFNP